MTTGGAEHRVAKLQEDSSLIALARLVTTRGVEHGVSYQELACLA